MARNENDVLQTYKELKVKHPNAIVFLRLGDFYETFDTDAQIAADDADLIVLTRNLSGGRVKMCGFPYHMADRYITRLVKAGHRVAIGERIVEFLD